MLTRVLAILAQDYINEGERAVKAKALRGLIHSLEITRKMCCLQLMVIVVSIFLSLSLFRFFESIEWSQSMDSLAYFFGNGYLWSSVIWACVAVILLSQRTWLKALFMNKTFRKMFEDVSSGRTGQ